MGYIVGIARNNHLREKVGELMDRAVRGYEATGRKQRLFGSVWYGGAHLGPYAAGDREGGVYRPGNESPLRGDQPRADGPSPV